MAWKVFRWTFVQIILVVNLTVAQTDLWETMKKGQLMAADEATLKMAMNMALANDYEAMAELTLLGRLALSKGGEQVAYVKVHQFTIEVRKKGSAKVWWIPIDALKEDNPKLAEEEPELEKYDHNATEAEYLKEIADTLAKNKYFAELAKKKTAGKSGGVLSEAQRIARWFIDRGKELEKEGEVGDVQYWRATKIWVQMGFSPDSAAALMPVFADTLIGEDGAVGDHDLPGLMGDAIHGKKPALDKLGISVQKFRSIGNDRFR
jgi:hypothetical protein